MSQVGNTEAFGYLGSRIARRLRGRSELLRNLYFACVLCQWVSCLGGSSALHKWAHRSSRG